MKFVKFVASFLLFLGILALMIWAGIKSNDQKCDQISILINCSENSILLTESDILQVLKHHKVEWKDRAIKEVELAFIHQILAQENYIKSVDKVHFLGSKLQIEVTLYNILLEVQAKNGSKFLLDDNGLYLPYSPKVGNDVIVARGAIPYSFHSKEKISPNSHQLTDLFCIASLIKEDSFYSKLFRKLEINEKQEITLCPIVGNLPVLFGTTQNAASKLKSLKYMYDDVLPYLSENKYAQLDVRFKNRIIATKTKT